MNGERKPLLLPEITSRRRSSLLDSNSATNSPFNTGIPMIFPSPIPSPRPHRLSFSFVKKEDKIYDFHVLLTLLMSVIGAGMLSLPYTFVLIDSWQCVLGIVAVGISMATTATALLYTHVELAKEEEAIMHVGAGKKFCSFQSIAIIAGGRSFGYFVSFVTAIGIYGGCVGSIRIVRDIAPFLMNLFFYLTKSNHYLDDVGSQHAAMDWIMWITFIFIVFPLCLLKNLSGLRISSYLGFVFSIYLVIAIIYRSFHLLDPFGPPHNYNPLIIDPLGNHTVGMVGNGTTSIPKVPLL
jgi:sodium-coupled neutral amino acid transporter 3